MSDDGKESKGCICLYELGPEPQRHPNPQCPVHQGS